MKPEDYLLIAAAGWAVCGILGGIIGSEKNATGAGVATGLVFGPLGVIAAFVRRSG
jgi:hypothetical protein